MTFPPRSVMELLAAIDAGREFVVLPESGRMAVMLTETTYCHADGDDLDALMERGWVVVDDDAETVTVTEQGAYAVRRWMRANRLRANVPAAEGGDRP